MTNLIIPGVLVGVSLIATFIYRSFYRVRRDFSADIEERLAGAPRSYPALVITGMMGAGKSTFAKSLAKDLGIAHIEIDLCASEEEITQRLAASPAGWVAEANPWQIPPLLFLQATTVVLLDYDNIVSYLRLLFRGLSQWRSAQYSPRAFQQHVVNKIVLDLWRIVFLYGKANRTGWRHDGLAEGLPPVSPKVFRCVSPAEGAILHDAVKRWKR